jgi:hypothetical protein
MTTRSIKLPAKGTENAPRSIPTAQGLGQKEIPKALQERLRDFYFIVTNLVFRNFGIDAIAPSLNAASQVLYLKARLLQELSRFLAAAA